MDIHDGQELPNPRYADVSALADVLQSLSALAEEIRADLVTEEFRLAQYRRVAGIGEWLTTTADRLHYILDREINPDDYPD